MEEKARPISILMYGNSCFENILNPNWVSTSIMMLENPGMEIDLHKARLSSFTAAKRQEGKESSIWHQHYLVTAEMKKVQGSINGRSRARSQRMKVMLEKSNCTFVNRLPETSMRCLLPRFGVLPGRFNKGWNTSSGDLFEFREVHNVVHYIDDRTCFNLH